MDSTRLVATCATLPGAIPKGNRWRLKKAPENMVHQVVPSVDVLFVSWARWKWSIKGEGGFSIVVRTPTTYPVFGSDASLSFIFRGKMAGRTRQAEPACAQGLWE